MSDADARALFDVGPADYVAQRDRLAKQLREIGDKAGAAALKRLPRPALSMWAVLAAGGDDEAVRELVDVTRQLAEVQGGGGDRSAVNEAARHRRALVDSFTDRALDALGRYESGAPARRMQIRVIVDQLARHPELTQAWIDGTLRDVPDANTGFEVFQAMELPTRESRAVGESKATGKRSGTPRPDRDDEAAREAERRRVAERAEARQALQTARDDAARARRAAQRARADVERASEARREAEATERAADEAVTAAEARMQALDAG